MSEELFKLLAKDYYILYLNGELVITNKLLRKFAIPPLLPSTIEPETSKIVQTKAETPVVLPDMLAGLKQIKAEAPNTSPLLKFIKDCEVPEKINTPTGAYWCNRFSVKAEKELILILSKGYKYDVLVVSTKLYYKAGGMPKMISNYILDGVWRGCYEDMIESLKNNTVQQHIKSNMNKSDDEGFSRYER